MSNDNKRYYWLKLKDDFFRQKEIKQLRRVAGGDSYTIIYLKMLLRSLKDGGKLYYDGVDVDFASELALDIDEDAENVKMTVAFLMSKGILVQSNTDEYALLTADEMTGSECDSAERMRRLREKRLIASQSDALVTDGDVEKRDKRKDNRDKSKSIESSSRKRFTPPTADEVRAYADEKGYTIDAQRFVDFYESKGWMVGKSPMRDWRASVRNWVSRDGRTQLDRSPQSNPAISYKQREYSAGDDDKLFVDLDEYLKEG